MTTKTTQSNVKALIVDALEEVKDMELMDGDAPINDEFILVGRGAVLQSIGLASFVTGLEERIEDELDIEHTVSMRDINVRNNGAEMLTVGDMARVLSDILS